eukprot:Awhi_evm1s5309
MSVLYNFFFLSLVLVTTVNSLSLHEVLSCNNENGQYKLTISEVFVPEVDCTELNLNEDTDVVNFTTSVSLTFQVEKESATNRRTNCTDSGSEYFFVDFAGQLQRKGGCSNIKSLELDRNPFVIRSVNPEVFQNMPDLKYLSFE